MRRKQYFDVELACEIGLFPAVVVDNFQSWIFYNRANGRNFKDGHYWTYNSMKALCEIFPYQTEEQIRYAIKKLLDKEILIKGNYNAMPTDRTLWYAFKDEEKWLENSQMDLGKFTNGFGNNPTPIPYSIPYNNSSSSSIWGESFDDIYNSIISQENLQLLLYRNGLIKGEEPKEKMDEIIKDYVKEFYEGEICKGEKFYLQTPKQVRAHFANWLPKYLKAKNNDKNNGGRHTVATDRSRGPLPEVRNDGSRTVLR